MTGTAFPLLATGCIAMMAGYIPVYFGIVSRRQSPAGWTGVAVIAGGVTLVLAADLLDHEWGAAAIEVVALGVLLLILWRRWWRRRKHALRALGYKGRARVAALVSAMRERARPRHVLRPAPQGGGR